MAARATRNTARRGPTPVEAAMRSMKADDIQSVYLLFGEEVYLQERFLQHVCMAWLGEEENGFNTEKVDGKGMSQAEAVAMASQMTLLAGRRLVLIDEPAFIPVGRGGSQGESAPQEGDDPFLDDDGAAEGRGQDQVDDPDGGDDPLQDIGCGSLGIHTGAAESGARAAKGAKGAKADPQPLLAYLEAPSPFTCLVLRIRKGKPDGRQKLVAEITKREALIEASTPSIRDRLPYLREMLQDLGKKCPDSLLHRLAAQPGDLISCQKELEKIAAYAGDAPTLMAEMFDQMLTPNIESKVFDLTDAIALRRRDAALRELRVMLENGESPFYVFTMILRQFRMIFQAKIHGQDGLKSKEIAKVMGWKDYPAQKALEQSRHYGFPALEAIMELLCETDLAMKSVSANELGQILENLVIDLGA